MKKNPSKSENNTTVIIVRHGQTDFNFERRFQGQMDVPLNALGREQGKQSAEVILKLMASFPESLVKSTQVFSSDLSRAATTAETICDVLRTKYGNQISLRRDRLLREQNTGLLQGNTLDEFTARFPEQAQSFNVEDLLHGLYHCRPPGPDAESKYDVAIRTREFMKTTLIPAVTKMEGGLFIVCGHGWALNVLMDLMSAVLKSSDPYVGNGDVIVTSSHGDLGLRTPIACELEIGCGFQVLQHIEVGVRIGHVVPAKVA